MENLKEYIIIAPVEFGARMELKETLKAESPTHALEIYYKKFKYDYFDVFTSDDKQCAAAIDLSRHTILSYAVCNEDEDDDSPFEFELIIT